MNSQRPVGLTLLDGGAAPERVAGVRLWWGAQARPPFPPQAVVREEDRWLVLSAPLELTTEAEHPIRLMTAVWEARPRALGTVVLRRASPPELLAVVHDLDADPTCSEDRVEEALTAAFATATHHRWRALAVEPLGCVHGRLAPERFAGLLRRLLVTGQADGVDRLWVMADRPA